MTTLPNLEQWAYAERRAHAVEIRGLAPAVARSVTDDFFRRYPSWLEAYGLTGVDRGVEDARFHIEFLAAAIEGGNPNAFADYIAWAARVLSSRHIRTNFLIENIEQVRDALMKQLDPAIAAVVKSVVQHAFSAFDAGNGRKADVINAAVNVYVSAALSGQRTAALNIAREALQEGASVIDVYCDLLQPAQYELGRMWETNQISVAEEHLATGITQYVIGKLSNELPKPESVRGNVVVTGVDGELHQLGAQMLADALEAEGWNVHFLGSQVPLKDIASFVRDHEADALALSVTMLFNVRKAAQLIEDVRREHGDRIRIVVGGSAFHANQRLWREIGADGLASDLRAGLALLKRLVN
ncbi:MAG TPA: cobalamin-dependent protein [Longimicrobiales bacterium]